VTPDELVQELRQIGVRLWEEGGDIHFRAPRGVLTRELKEAIRSSKPSLVEHLRGARQRFVIEPDPEHRYDPFPLTDVQAAYVLGRRDVFRDGGPCQVYVELAFPELDPRSLTAAWNRLIRRHPMLRAEVVDGIYQRIRRSVPAYEIETEDLRGKPAAEAEAAADRNRRAMSHRLYQLDRWPPFELRMVRLDEGDVLHVSIDFFVADFTSVQILVGELQELCRHPDSELAPLPIDFRDYVIAAAQHRSGGAQERDRSYWVERIPDLAPAPDLPRARGVEQGTGAFTRMALTIEPLRWERLVAEARRHGLTPSTVVLSAYADVLARWSRSSRFTVNVTLLSRPEGHHGLAGVVGDFTSVNLLELHDQPERSFVERARAVGAQLFEDLDHSSFSGIAVMRELARSRGSEAARFPVVFTSTLGMPAATGHDVDLRFGISQTPQVWIDCQAHVDGNGLTVNWDVRAGVFAPGMAEAMFEAFTDLVHSLASTPARWTGTGSIDLPHDQRRARGPGTASPLAAARQNLVEAILASAQVEPARTAVISTDRTLTYGELIERAAGVAARLTDLGCRRSSVVAIVMEKGWEQIVAVLGTMLAGGTYLPIDTNQPSARAALLAATAGAEVALTQARVRGLVPPGLPAVAVETVEPAPWHSAVRPSDPDDPAYVIFTSGSTGAPKGVVIDHAAAANTVHDINRRFAVEPGDRVLGLTNLGFDLSVYDIFGLLGAGGSIVLPDAADRTNPGHWADLIDRHGVTLWNSVPAQLQMLDQYLRSDEAVNRYLLSGAISQLTTLRLALLSGDWIPVRLPDQIRERVPRLEICSLGGATEASIWSIAFPIEEVRPEWASIPYGKALGGQQVLVLNDRHQECPDWTVGEIYIVGAGLARGYIGDKARTAERFVTLPGGERAYRTGDLGRYLPDGNIEFLGREDRQVKLRGHRVELAEVEAALQAVTDVEAATVVVRDGATVLDRSLAAFVQPSRAPEPVRRHRTSSTAHLLDRFSAAEHAVRSAVPAASLLEFSRRMDDFSLVAMHNALNAIGVLDGAGTEEPIPIRAGRCGVPAKYHRLVARWVDALTQAGWLTARPADLKTAWRAVEELRPSCGYQPQLLDYFRASAEVLPELVTGRADPLELLFPDGESTVQQAAYASNPLSDYLNGVICRTIRAVAEDRLEASGRCHILEVGGGVAATSRVLIPELAAAAGPAGVSYHFTDVSQFFLNGARAEFEDYPWVSYGIFDMNLDYRGQGLAPNSFDIVVAANVLHYARDLGRVLDRVRELLRPEGWLAAIELVHDSYPVMASMELVEGLSGFEDDRRGTTRNFNRRDQWLRRLAAAGASATTVFPDVGDQLTELGQDVLLAQFKTDRVRVLARDVADQIRTVLPEYMVPASIEIVDELPLTTNGKVDYARLRSWLPDQATGVRAGVAEPRDDLERSVAELWGKLLGRGSVGRNEDFYQLGGDSLLIAQLAGRIREEIPEARGVKWDALVQTMVHVPTVAAVASLIRREQAEADGDEEDDKEKPVVVPLGLVFYGTPRILFHDATGTMLAYRELARELAPTMPVLGAIVTDLDWYRSLPEPELIARIADRYTEALLDMPFPGFDLMGYSVGGIIAVEVARRLAEAGSQVERVTLVGTARLPYLVDEDLVTEYAFARAVGTDVDRLGYPPSAALGRAADVASQRAGGRLSAGWYADDGLADGEAIHGVAAQLASLAATPQRARLQRIRDAARATRWRSLMDRAAGDPVPAVGGAIDAAGAEDDTEDLVNDLYQVFRRTIRAAARFEPAPYAGHLNLIRLPAPCQVLPTASVDYTGWERTCLGDLTVADGGCEADGYLAALEGPAMLRIARHLSLAPATRAPVS
jgi:pyochelin synthetase